MKINWQVRIRNPVFWAQVLLSILAPVLAYFGLSWEDMTTWTAIGGMLVRAVQNPVVVVAVIVSLWNTLNDPTTAGLGDSARALGYQAPYKDGEK